MRIRPTGRWVRRIVPLFPRCCTSSPSYLVLSANLDPLKPRNHIWFCPGHRHLRRLDALPIKTRQCPDRPLRVYLLILLLFCRAILPIYHSARRGTLQPPANLSYASIAAVRTFQCRRRRKLGRCFRIQNAHLQRLFFLFLPILDQLLARQRRRIHLHQP